MTEQDEQARLTARMKMVEKIGGMGIAMLAICIPIVAIIQDAPLLLLALLPILVIIGTGVGMVTVWRSSSHIADSREIEELQRQVADLHARLSNLEMMDSYERRLAQREAQAELHQGPSTPPTDGTSTPDVIQPMRQTERQG